MVRRHYVVLFSVWLFTSQAIGQLPPPPGIAAPKNQPRLYVEQRTQELGRVLEGSIVPVRWRLVNQGDADLIITSTKAACGCTVIQLDEKDKIIPPGGSVDINAEYNSKGRRSEQLKTITVYSNDPAEPDLKLKFHASVYRLYMVKPSGFANLGSLQRGQTATKTIDMTPVDNQQTLEISEIISEQKDLFRFTYEPLKHGVRIGQRIFITAADEAPMGKLQANVTITFSVGGIPLQYEMVVRARVVGDIAWQPRVIDTTRQISLPGKNLSPVIVHSTDRSPFEIIEIQENGMFETSFGPLSGAPPQTRYRVKIKLREDVPPGPFGTNLRLITSSVDQPVINIPVYGNIAEPLAIDPPLIYLVQDGTPKGVQRLVKIQVPVRSELKIADIQCSNKAVTAQINWDETGRYRHIRYLDVWLSGTLPEGTHQAKLTMSSTIEGFEHLEIPVTIRVPKK